MTTTIVRAAIEPRPVTSDQPEAIQLVISVNPFSSIQHPRQAAPAAYVQRYHIHPNGRTTLVRESRYSGPDAEREACEEFDNKHAATDAA